MSLLRLCFFAALHFAARSLQQSKNPVTDFCRRWGHQTAQIDGKLYIDGGLVAWDPLSAKSLNYSNTWLLYSDLNSIGAQSGMPNQYANLSKKSEVPSVSGGILWADEVNKCFYLYGGEYQGNPSDFSFWTYDTILNQWNETKYKSNVNVNSIQRVSYGAGTQLNDLGVGFYYGGWQNNHTIPGWAGNPVASSSLMRYDFTDNFLRNTSGPDSIGRAEGSMVYLPASDGGILIYFGGVEDAFQNGTYIGADMSTIHIYDVRSSRWYKQNASGSVPPSRRQFCAGVTWADDKSSYNIYLYGGFSTNSPNFTGFDDTYILTIPSFKWIKAWPLKDGSTNENGHGGCSANVINADQMLIIGGWFPSTTRCDSAEAQGQHGMNLGYNGPQSALWDAYDPKLSKYFVPTPVISVIGGGPTGGATLRKPTTFDNPDLETYFTRTPSFSARTATRIIPSITATSTGATNTSKTNVGAIAGGVIGGLVVLIAVLCLILFCIHRRQKTLKKGARKEKASPPPPEPEPVELAATAPIHEMNSPGATKYIDMREPAPESHPAYSGPNSLHSRSPSDHHRSLSNQPLQLHQLSPNPPLFPASHSLPHGYEFLNDQSQHHSPTYPPYSDNPSPYDTQVSTYNPNAYPPSHNLLSPISPIHPNLTSHQQPQIYYPPPADPAQRSYPSSFNRIETPDGTFYSSDTEPPLPPSTSHTPAHFYARPGESGRSDRISPTHGGEGSNTRLLGDGGVKLSPRAIDRRRPVRGKFVEDDRI